MELRKAREECSTTALSMIEAVRSLGLAGGALRLRLPARPGAGWRRPRRVRRGPVHARVQAYLPGAGWIEFDATDGLVGGAHLIRAGVVRDPSQATPLQGQLPRRRDRLPRHAGRGQGHRGGIAEQMKNTALRTPKLPSETLVGSR
jgi:transglutaminase-like putative cysteine protease